MQYLTAARAAQYRSLQGIDEGQKAQILGDANRVERHVAHNDFIDDDDLRRWGEAHDLPPDRINAALRFLTEADRIVGLVDSTPPATRPVTPAEDREQQTTAAARE